MKVLKPGKPQKWTKEVTCQGRTRNSGCGAVLLIEAEDLYRTVTTTMGREPTFYTTYKCCECGIENDLGGVPYNITSELKER